MEKKQYTAPRAEVLSNAFEDIIVASGGTNIEAANEIVLPDDVLDGGNVQ